MDEYERAIEDHKNSIAVAKRDIRKYKLLIKQVKLSRKLHELNKGWALTIPVEDFDKGMTHNIPVRIK